MSEVGPNSGAADANEAAATATVVPVKFKSLKEEVVTLDVSNQSKIGDVQKQLSEKINQNVTKLIIKGQCLKDDTLFNNINYQPSDHIIYLCAKMPPQTQPKAEAKPKVEDKAPTANTTSASSNPPPATGSTATPETRQRSEAPPAPAQSAPTGALGGSVETAIEGFLNMGFSREESLRALSAAFGNPDRAVEYLLNGIPENVVQSNAAPAQQPHPYDEQNATEDDDGEDNDDNDAQGLPGNLGGMNAESNQLLARLLHAIQEQPELLPMLQQQLQDDPQLAGQNDDVLRMMAAAGVGQQGQAAAAAPAAGQRPPNAGNVIEITQQERVAISRLQELGFSETAAAQAYFACEKNEEAAADFLFNNQADFQD